jgi:xanthine dehydrogenase accessory factor
MSKSQIVPRAMLAKLDYDRRTGGEDPDLKNADAIFGFLIEAAHRGERYALVTITKVTGGSSREIGTHLAVTEDGTWLGSLSGGCIEAAVVGEARRIIASGRAEMIRFGEGSHFIDIRLPCGGAIDLLFTPMPPLEALIATRDSLLDRRTAVLGLATSGEVKASLSNDQATGWLGSYFFAVHEPDLRIIIMGHGAECEALWRLATSYGARVELLSPDSRLIMLARSAGLEAIQLDTPRQALPLAADPHTAVVLLFHDHDWEEDLLHRVLGWNPFYIGAMGSRLTHERRLEALHRSGADKWDLDRIKGPIGFLPSSRDPETLALSVLGEIVSCRVSTRRRQSHLEMS